MAWIQYPINDGSSNVVVSQKVDDALLASRGNAQIECPDEMGDPAQYSVDITQTPPVLIPVVLPPEEN